MKILLVTIVALASLTIPAWSHGFEVGDIELVHPHLRATPPAAKTTAGYVTIKNNGPEADRLLGIETTAAQAVQFHRTVVEQGVARMQPIKDGFELKPMSELGLGADGTHIMFVGLTAPAAEGELDRRHPDIREGRAGADVF